MQWSCSTVLFSRSNLSSSCCLRVLQFRLLFSSDWIHLVYWCTFLPQVCTPFDFIPLCILQLYLDQHLPLIYQVYQTCNYRFDWRHSLHFEGNIIKSVLSYYALFISRLQWYFTFKFSRPGRLDHIVYLFKVYCWFIIIENLLSWYS